MVAKLSEVFSPTIILSVLILSLIYLLSSSFGWHLPEFFAVKIGSGVFVSCSDPSSKNNPVCDRSKAFQRNSKPTFPQKPDVKGFNLY